MLRNIFSVFTGVIISITEILFFIKFTKIWFFRIKLIPLVKMKYIFINASNNFFLILILLCTFSVLSGNIITAFIVKYAKIAYARLTGIISLLIILLYILFFPLTNFIKFIMVSIFFILSYLSSFLSKKLIKILHRNKWI
ncbi:hypothetical protein [Blattabacterium cuenoti]|uniref:hypothetical protein n=1 Tax=Blattabacterium cuenoti TaxID=1653831 RepID=UPI00163C7171|nr:hypothetical protein [Blattabacterium cuenoti]